MSSQPDNVEIKFVFYTRTGVANRREQNQRLVCRRSRIFSNKFTAGRRLRGVNNSKDFHRPIVKKRKKHYGLRVGGGRRVHSSWISKKTYRAKQRRAGKFRNFLQFFFLNFVPFDKVFSVGVKTASCSGKKKKNTRERVDRGSDILPYWRAVIVVAPTPCT